MQNETLETTKHAEGMQRAEREQTLQLEWKTQSDNSLLQKQLKNAKNKISILESEIENLEEEKRKLEKIVEKRDEEIGQSKLEALRLKLETKKLSSNIKELEGNSLIDKEVRRLTDLNVRLMKKNEKLELGMQEKMNEIAQVGFQIIFLWFSFRS